MPNPLLKYIPEGTNPLAKYDPNIESIPDIQPAPGLTPPDDNPLLKYQSVPQTSIRALKEDEQRTPVPWYDPRRILRQYEYMPPVTAREVGKAQAEVIKEGITTDEGNLIKFKEEVGGSLTPKETFIRFMAYPQHTKIVQQGLVDFTNNALLGIPEYALNRMGYEKIQPETTAETVTSGLSSLLGFATVPLKLAARIAPKLPVIGKAFMPIGTKAQSIIKPLLRTGASLGTASAISDITDPKGMPERFGSGFIAGAPFGALSFIPSTPVRAMLSTAYLGIPSTLREEPLETQVFKYGLGAYFGLKRGMTPKELLKKELPMAKMTLAHVMREGVPAKKFQQQENIGKTILKQMERDVDTVGAEPMTSKARFQNILKQGGRASYQPVVEEKGWRKTNVNFIWKALNTLKKSPAFALREDDLPAIVKHLSPRKALAKNEIAKLDNTDLYNLSNMLREGQIPYFNPQVQQIFKSRPLAKKELVYGKHINLWDKIFRPGYRWLEKMGFGNIHQGGLTSDFYGGDVGQAQFLNRHYELTNTWKQMVGFKKGTSQLIFQYLDGKIPAKSLNPKQLTAANQMRQYYNLLLKQTNRYRAQYGEDPIKPEKNYITHIFDGIKKDMIQKRHPFPEYIESMMKWIVPKERRNPFILRRKGVLGYEQDAWKALDSYAYYTSGSVNDVGVRRANKVIRFTQKEMRLNEELGRRSPIDWSGIQRNVQNYVNDYMGRPGYLSDAIRGTMDATFNKYLPPGLQIRSLMDITNAFNGLVYGASMGFRPKLAIRNLGQHSLIFGEVGTKPFLKAITTSSKKAEPILKHSRVLDTRKLHFAPEIQPAFTGRIKSQLSRSAFWLYRKADWINVRNAFLSGYYEAKAKGLPDTRAYLRGDEVAAKTQYLYLKGNRSGLGRGLGLSPEAGRVMGVFTTWPTNWMELQLSWAKPGHRQKLARYLALNVGLAGLGAAAGIKPWRYTGIESPLSLLKLFKGQLPIGGVTERPPIPPQIIKDIEKSIEEEDLRELLFYTWRQK